MTVVILKMLSSLSLVICRFQTPLQENTSYFRSKWEKKKTKRETEEIKDEHKILK